MMMKNLLMKAVDKKMLKSLPSSPWFLSGTGTILAGVGGYLAYEYLWKDKKKRRLSSSFFDELKDSPKLKEKCQKIMSKSPVTLTPEDTILHAAQLMKQEDIGSIPVVEGHQSRKLVGIITDRDIVMHLGSEHPDIENARLENLMTRELVTCHDTDKLEKALTAMSEHQVKRIPVVDRKARLVGIISQADVARSVKEPQVTGEVVKEITH